MEQKQNSPSQVPDAFVTALTEAQEMLSVYVRTLLGGDAAAAKDVLQETNLYLWKNAAEFPKVRCFAAWAKSLALMQVRKYRLYRQREGERVVFDETVFEAVAEKLTVEENPENCRLEAFNHCLGLLPAEDRELLNQKYLDRVPAAELAGLAGTTVSAVNSRLHRIRAALDGCMNKALCRLSRGGEL